MVDKKIVINMLSNGETVKSTAGKLGMNRRTLEYHIRQICKQHNCVSSTQLVAKFIRKGLICLFVFSLSSCTKIFPCYHCDHVNTYTGEITHTKYWCGSKSHLFKDKFGNDLQTECYK